jgi:hypothetical protein
MMKKIFSDFNIQLKKLKWGKVPHEKGKKRKHIAGEIKAL